jgi:hypothetical protein
MFGLMFFWEGVVTDPFPVMCDWEFNETLQIKTIIVRQKILGRREGFPKAKVDVCAYVRRHMFFECVSTEFFLIFGIEGSVNTCKCELWYQKCVNLINCHCAFVESSDAWQLPTISGKPMSCFGPYFIERHLSWFLIPRLCLRQLLQFPSGAGCRNARWPSCHPRIDL